MLRRSRTPPLTRGTRLFCCALVIELLAGLLDHLLRVAVGLLRLSGDLVRAAARLEVLVANRPARHLLNLALRPLCAALDLILVHGSLLVFHEDTHVSVASRTLPRTQALAIRTIRRFASEISG